MESTSSASRLTTALAEIESFPVERDSRAALLSAASGGCPHAGPLIDAVESDVGLTITALRLANSGGGARGQSVGTIPEAIEAVGVRDLLALTRSSQTFDHLNARSAASRRFELFTTHALAVQGEADRLATLTGNVDRDQLAVAALLHDLGGLAISELWPDRNPREAAVTCSPEDRVRDERRRLRLDHAVIGGVLARRWRLPDSIAKAIERHHAADASDLAAHVSLADMVVHHRSGNAVDVERVRGAARSCGLGITDLRQMLRAAPGSVRRTRDEPCPLSSRELQVLQKLSEGKVYKQIAADLELSVSTIRNHLHNTYSKMDVNDRAQAVLSASRLGWI